MASKTGMFLSEEERRKLIQSLESTGDLVVRTANKSKSSSGDLFSSTTTVTHLPLVQLPPGNDTGCLVCGRDDDHNNLMLCEGCNDEYHIYCLDPPLSAVPPDDWYCDACCGKTKRMEVHDDGLASRVTALPREFTSRFGEVCFAYGGFGFGWWPSCIFDPRLTEGSARQTARKNLGKKHLIYFFECHEAPFAVLSNSKITSWHEGLAENYHLGKTAKASGKQRGLQFQQALQAAIVEEDKPLEMRLDWNRSDEQPQLLPIPKQHQQAQRKRKRATDVVHLSPGIKNSSSTTTTRVESDSDDDSRGQRRKKTKKRRDDPLFCKILKRPKPLNIERSSTGNSPPRDDINIGFVKLRSSKQSTFADLRRAIKKHLVPEALSRKTIWNFHLSTLGPVTAMQETSLGPLLPFLRSGMGGNATNGGTIEDPIKVLIAEL